MKLLKFLFQYSPKFILLAAVMGVIGGLASTAVLVIMNNHLREIVSEHDYIKFFGLCLIILFSNIAARACIAGLSQWSAFDLRLQLGRQWISKPLPELEKNGSARMMAAITNDVDRLSNSMHIMPTMCIDITVIVSCMIYLAYLSWPILLIMTTFIVFAIYTRSIPQKKCDKLLTEAHSYGEQIVETYHAMRSGIKELKMNRKRWNEFYSGELYSISTKLRDKRYQAELIFGFIRGYSEIIYFLFVGILIFGADITGKLSLEIIVGFAVTLLFMKTNIDHVLENIGQITVSTIALNNLESLGVISQSTSLTLADLRLRTSQEKISKELESDANLREKLPTTLNDGICFKDIEYRYENNESGESGFSIGPINLKVDAGEILFVIGGNGSGKTTFAKVLCGLYKPSTGSIFVDGTEITDGNRSWYSQYFGSVFSDSYLFGKLYGSGDLIKDSDKILEYLKELKLHDKVEVLDGRFSTTSLSQGQRKRLALLTAYLEDRPLYLFDEWAADQDPEFREFFYLKILPDLKKQGKTVVAISHDDRYYHAADRVVKFEEGRFFFMPTNKEIFGEESNVMELVL